MDIKTKSTVTITMTGTEASKLAVWLYTAGADNQRPDAPARTLLEMLRELHDEDIEEDE